MTSKRKWLAAAAIAAAAAALLFHASLLRCLAGFLVVDEPIGDTQYVALLGWCDRQDADGGFDLAVKLYRQKPSHGILVIEPHPDRTVEIGVLWSFEKYGRYWLKEYHVPQEAISAIHSDGSDDWATARTLQTWLTEKPNVSILLPCDAFRSAHVRSVLDAVLDPGQAARVRVHALPNRLYDETNWWTTRLGIKAFGIEWLRRLHGWCAGGDHRPPPFHSVADYQRTLRQALLETPP